MEFVLRLRWHDGLTDDAPDRGVLAQPESEYVLDQQVHW